VVTVLHASVPQRSLKKNSSVPRSGLGAGRKKNPHNQFHSHSVQASNRLLRSNFILPQGKKKINPPLPIISKLYITGRKERKKSH